MAAEFEDTEDTRYTALYCGVVVDNVDPEGLGRVRVRIPGLIEPASAFAFPLGTVGGGSNRRGFFSVPEKGADVGVLFHQGDVDHPFYLTGHWGKPDAIGNEVPEPAKDADPAKVPKIKSFETERWLLFFDDNEGQRSLTIRDKVSGDQIEFDGEGLGITIQATSALIIKADGLVDIRGAQVQINGRVVQASGKPL